jgi:hypothetical protein
VRRFAGAVLVGGGLTLLMAPSVAAQSQHGVALQRSLAPSRPAAGVSGQTTEATPGLATTNGLLYVAWTGQDAGHHLNIESSSNATSWGNKVTLNESALDQHSALPGSGITGPRLLTNFFNGRLYVAWTGTTHQLNIGYFTGSATLAGKVTLAETTQNTPGLAIDRNGVLYLAWVGTDASHHLNVISSSDGLTWGNKRTLTQNTGTGFGLYGPGFARLNVASGDNVWLAYYRPTGDGTVICTGRYNGTTSLQNVSCPGSLDGAWDLNLTQYASTFYVTFRGHDLNDVLLWGTSPNGTSWSGPFNQTLFSDAGTSATVFVVNGVFHLYVALEHLTGLEVDVLA